MSVPRPAVLLLLVLTVVLVSALVLATPWAGVTGPASGTVTPVDPDRDFSAAEQAAAASYQSAVGPPLVLGLGVGLVVALLLGLTPVGGRLVQAAGGLLGGGWVAQVVLGTAALVLVGRAAVLPLDLWGARVRRDAGLLTQPAGAWWVDQGKALLVTLVLTIAAMLAMVALARRWPATWWLPAAGGVAVLVVVVSFAYPVVVEPLFARFEPLPAGPQRDRLLGLAERSGVPVADVLVSDASARGTALNAYVSGFGATRRLVVYDTLLARAEPAEVDAVVAHELGHAARADVLVGTVLAALAAACGVLVLAIALSWQPLLARAGADGPGDPRAVALALAVVAVLSAVTGPATVLVSRQVEARADVHALDLTGDPLAVARLQKRLAVANRSALDPPAWRYAWFATHPTAPQRLAATRDWAVRRGVPGPPDLAGEPMAGPGLSGSG